ncbi:hypothetical protein EVA_08403 [gut metagenome]|uniref:Uncharacterized protein n=1 Tax=gut metagenome TaxID=749906 RepID=J9CTE2_9ZZZZ
MAVILRFSRWKPSTCISPATFMPLLQLIICLPLLLTMPVAKVRLS